MQSVRCEVVDEKRFGLAELRAWVSKITDRHVPESTFRYWRSKAGVTPEEDGTYGSNELRFLVELAYWLSDDNKHTIQEFRENWFNANRRSNA